MIRGRLKLLMEGSDQQALLDFVDAALHVPERKALLEVRTTKTAYLLKWRQNKKFTLLVFLYYYISRFIVFSFHFILTQYGLEVD